MDALLTHGDYYMHLADLQAYVQAQTRIGLCCVTPEAWTRMAIINVGCSGMFSSDRAIQSYASDVWQAQPCPVS